MFWPTQVQNVCFSSGNYYHCSLLWKKETQKGSHIGCDVRTVQQKGLKQYTHWSVTHFASRNTGNSFIPIYSGRIKSSRRFLHYVTLYNSFYKVLLQKEFLLRRAGLLHPFLGFSASHSINQQSLDFGQVWTLDFQYFGLKCLAVLRHIDHSRQSLVLQDGQPLKEEAGG